MFLEGKTSWPQERVSLRAPPPGSSPRSAFPGTAVRMRAVCHHRLARHGGALRAGRTRGRWHSLARARHESLCKRISVSGRNVSHLTLADWVRRGASDGRTARSASWSEREGAPRPPGAASTACVWRVVLWPQNWLPAAEAEADDFAAASEQTGA